MIRKQLHLSMLVLAGLLSLTACNEVLEQSTAPVEGSVEDSSPHEQRQPPGPGRGDVGLDMPADVITVDAARNAKRQAYFGDLHVHTAYSYDAHSIGTVATPYDAYRYAKGETIKHPAGFDLHLRAPLDFYAVTDHAVFLGVMKAAADTSTEFSSLPHAVPYNNLDAPENQNLESVLERRGEFTKFGPKTLTAIADGTVDQDMVDQISMDAWSDIVNAAISHYRPGEFTTFVGYEFTPRSDYRGGLHRNVIFRDADKLPAMPFSRLHSRNPEDLWHWMDDLRSQGVEALAIPHNSNGSNGQMFKLADWAGNPLDDEYAQRRLRNEPLVEITQVKGTSETHPALSTTDEWADFEIAFDHYEPRGSYARRALLDGLALEDKGLKNPYQFGFIGSSDTHTGASAIEEDNFSSKVAHLDAFSSRRGSIPLSERDAEILASVTREEIKVIGGKKYAPGSFETWGASGLAGVWAERNDRDAIYRAFRRKETFVTSGPRIKIRLFAGFDLPEDILSAADPVEVAYQQGVSQGSELHTGHGSPKMLVIATRDPDAAALQRLQIVKGWTVDGEHHERVYDIACSDGGVVDAATRRCPDNGARVDITDCSTTAGVGAGQLQTLWTDPDFDPDHRGFYYARVLENPTCRWSTWDAIRAGLAPREDLHATLQERAWTSPIWYVPLS